MSKELEALEGMFDLITSQQSFEEAQKCYYIIEEALERLEAFDNANPSEALECLEIMYDLYCAGYGINDERFKTIKQALIQAEKDKEEIKRLDIISKLVGDENSVKFEYNGKEIVAITSNRFEKLIKEDAK